MHKVKKSPEIRLEYSAACRILYAFDGFFLDLPYTFASELHLLAYLLESKGVLHADSEIEFQDPGFAW